ncbi:MAG: sulfatase [Candidatus Lernaella stagnicola]|nr:sulfatase [Candidatus Lernaella stagnicola]
MLTQRNRTIFLRITIAIFALVVLLLPGCKNLKQGRTGRQAKPPVVIFVIDTWRADHAGCYGYERNVTPNIDRWSQQATRFVTAHSPSSWTVPAMASMFTGVYPWSHGVVKAEISDASKVDYQPTLAEQFTTLAEAMKAAGYETFGVSGNYHLHEKYGMAQGFDHYTAFGFRTRDPVDLQIKDWLPKLQQLQRQGKPYFLFVLYFDPHHPYLPVEPFISQWRPDYDEDKLRELVGESFAKRAYAGDYDNDPKTLQIFKDLYDSEIAAADNSVGRWLKELPGIDDALVVVTADHGEAFADHQNMIHGTDLYNETVHVPLLVKFPGGEYAGKAPTHAVSTVDLYPTIADYTGASLPAYLEGQDLLAGLAKPDAKRYLFAETERAEQAHWRAVITTQEKWVMRASDKVQKFYNLLADPTEQRDLYVPEHEPSSKFYAVWVKHNRHKPLYEPGSAGEVTKELRDTLKELGYL